MHVRDVFVPEQHTASFGVLPEALPATPFARIPTGTRLAYNKVGVGFGIARAAIDHFVELATGKVPRFSTSRLAEQIQAQQAIARAEARLLSSRAFVLAEVERLWDTVTAGDRPSDRDRALIQLACSDAALACAEAVEGLVIAAGTSANRLDSPLEKHARDVRVIRQHVTVAPKHIDDAGRVLLGLPPEELMLKLGG